MSTPAGATTGTQEKGDARPEQYTDRRLLARLLRQARSHRGPLTVLLLLDLLATPLYLLTPVPLKVAIDSVIGDAPIPGYLDAVLPDSVNHSTGRLLVAVALLQVLFVLLIQLQQLAQLVVQKRTGESLTIRFRERLFRHIQRLSFGFLDSRGTADSIYRVQYDTPAIEWLTIHGIIPFAGAAFTLFSMVYVTARIDLRLAIIAVAVAPVVLVLMRGYKARMRPHYSEAKELQSSALHVVQETLGAFRVVKVFGREEEHSSRFERQSEKSLEAQVRLAKAEGVFGMSIQLTTAIGTALVLFLGAQSVLTGRLSVGDLTLVMAYLARLFSPVQTISKISASLQNYLASAQRVFEVLDQSPDIADRPDAEPIDRARGRIEARDMRFGYGDDGPVLEGVSLTVEPGSRVGVFGPTGAGKTTLLSLLMRVYDVDDGAVRLDGRDIRDYRVGDLREQFAVVLQDSVLFSTTIGENIAYGRPGANRDEIEAAAQAAGAHEFILDLPDGYDTMVGERGMRMSGGERQRIALARAFLKDAPILVLDEPTSSVDVQTETAIMSAMTRLMEGRTTFMIAHRLSTLAVCDMLVHVDGGTARVVDRSTLDALPTQGMMAASEAGSVRDRVDERGRDRHVPARTAAGPPPFFADHDPDVGADADGGVDAADVVREVLASEGYGVAGLTVLEHHRDPYAGDLHAELLTCEIGSERLRLHCARHPAGPAGRQAEPYAVHVHRRVLDGSDLPTLRLVGTHREPATGAVWVVTERPHESWRLSEIATADAMDVATRWLATFHRTFEFTSVADMPDLRRFRLDDYVSVAVAASKVTDAPGWLPRLAEGFAETADLLREPPLTAVVGATYPHNWMVADGRAIPVDLGSAAVGPGELDLATLLDGWPPDMVRRCTRLYRGVRWPDSLAEQYGVRLDMCRLYVQLREVADEGDKIPVWRIEALRDSGQRLGLL